MIPMIDVHDDAYFNWWVNKYPVTVNSLYISACVCMDKYMKYYKFNDLYLKTQPTRFRTIVKRKGMAIRSVKRHVFTVDVNVDVWITWNKGRSWQGKMDMNKMVDTPGWDVPGKNCYNTLAQRCFNDATMAQTLEKQCDNVGNMSASIEPVLQGQIRARSEERMRWWREREKGDRRRQGERSGRVSFMRGIRSVTGSGGIPGCPRWWRGTPHGAQYPAGVHDVWPGPAFNPLPAAEEPHYITRPAQLLRPQTKLNTKKPIWRQWCGLGEAAGWMALVAAVDTGDILLTEAGGGGWVSAWLLLRGEGGGEGRARSGSVCSRGLVSLPGAARENYPSLRLL